MISEAHRLYVVHVSDINTNDCSTNVSEPHHWRNGSHAGIQCSRSCIGSSVGSDYKIDFCCFFIKHTGLRRKG